MAITIKSNVKYSNISFNSLYVVFVKMSTETTTTTTTPQQTYSDAINFVDTNDAPTTTTTPPTTTTDPVKSENQMLKRILANFNDKTYFYPGLSILVMLILVLVILFQYIGTCYKLFSVMIFIVYVIFTVCVYKQQ